METEQILPYFLSPLNKLIKLNIIKLEMFLVPKLEIFDNKKIIHSRGESLQHIELKATAYYELLKRFKDSKILFEANCGTWGRVDLMCSNGTDIEVIVEVGDSNVSIYNVLDRGLNISEQIWLIPYIIDMNNLDIAIIYIFSRGEHWNFYNETKNNIIPYWLVRDNEKIQELKERLKSYFIIYYKEDIEIPFFME